MENSRRLLFETPRSHFEIRSRARFVESVRPSRVSKTSRRGLRSLTDEDCSLWKMARALRPSLPRLESKDWYIRTPRRPTASQNVWNVSFLPTPKTGTWTLSTPSNEGSRDPYDKTTKKRYRPRSRKKFPTPSKQQNPRKAPGQDGIANMALEELPHHAEGFTQLCSKLRYLLPISLETVPTQLCY
ncbi:uncharacterized protein LOC116162098 [Photinus pyralis]|uniref:uncharacterized protein LOC116162098 n=1 Tax=Photinus pyralis TaxID=7054 RepID=UPI0012675132|nr:uncharacterized protein LOC116162098 [Photinus pyralis]